MASRRFAVRAALFILTGLCVPCVAAAQTDCYAKWIKNAAEGIGAATPEELVLAREWYTRLTDADELTVRGMIKALETSELKAIVVNLETDRLVAGGIPFPADSTKGQIEEVYRAIGNLTRPDFQGVTGLEGKIGTIMSGSESNQLGALLDLKVADDIARETADITLITFEESFIVPATGSVRRYDVSQVDDTAILGAVLHENKNWPNGLSEGAADFRLREYADIEFPSDILLHAEDDFASYRVNLRGRVQELGQDSLVLEELLKKFDDPAIVAELGGPAQAAAKKATFEELWKAGKIREFH